MSAKLDIFGIKFDNLSVSEISSLFLDILRKEPRETPFTLFTPNPEIVMEARKDAELMRAMGTADFTSADGIGIVWASKYFGEKIKERASGYDIVQEIFALGDRSGGFSVFFLGGGAEVVAAAAERMENKYPNLKIVAKDGYFADSENDAVIARINACGADLLLVGLGSPKQEKWVAAHAPSLRVKAIITVGGSFDVMSGKLKRAPVVFRKLGLEWLYRLLRQPRRLKRMLRLPLFVIEVLKYNGNRRKRQNN